MISLRLKLNRYYHALVVCILRRNHPAFLGVHPCKRGIHISFVLQVKNKQSSRVPQQKEISVQVDFKRLQKRLKKLGVEVSTYKIKENWKLLKSEGCLLDHVCSYPKILAIPKIENLRYIEKLHEVGCDKISVGALRLARKYADELETKVKEHMNDDFSLTAKSCDILGCSQSKVDELLDKHPLALEKLTSSPKALKENVELLYKHDYTFQSILKYPQLLRFSPINLQEKLKLSHEIEMSENYPIKNLLDKSINDIKEIHHSACENKQSEMTPSGELSITLQTEPLKPRTQRKLIVLERSGYDVKEVMYKPVILKYSEKSIKQSIEYIKATCPESLGDLIHLVNVLIDKPNRRNKERPERLSKHIADILKVPFSSFSVTQKQIFGVTPLSTVDENMTFLREKGFRLKDIRTCPVLLVQDTNLVQKYYKELQSSEHLKQLRKNKAKSLNVIQYLIEFQSGADVEN